MEHILIGKGKLKLMLTKDDLDHYEIASLGAPRGQTSIDCADEKTRRAFRSLLDDVRRVSGFDTVSERIFIQLYPSKDGGAELYITRLCENDRSSKEPEPGEVRMTSVCQFGSMRELIDFCARFASHPIWRDVESEAWEGGGKTWLVVTEKLTYRAYLSRDPKNILGSASFIGDYCRILDGADAYLYIKEHCLCFCKKNAVKILGSMI